MPDAIGGTVGGTVFGERKPVCCAEDHNISAAFPCLHIPLVAKQCISMLDRDDADAAFLGEVALGRKLGTVGVASSDDVITKLFV